MGVKGNNSPDRKSISWIEAIILATEFVIYTILIIGGGLLAISGPLILAGYNRAWLLLYIPIIILLFASIIHDRNIS